MKKTAKSAAKKAPAKAAPKKSAAPAKKPVAKAKVSKAAPAKASAKKPVHAKVVAKTTKAAVKAKPTKKPVPKSAPKPVKSVKVVAKKPTVKNKSQASLQKNIQQKIVTSKNKAAEKATKHAAVIKKVAPAPKVDTKKLDKANKEKEKIEKLAAKESEKAQAKANKLAAQEAAKAPKKLSAKEKKELLKSQGKKGASLEEELDEDGTPLKRRVEEDDEEDDFEKDAAPKKVKMTFDEDIEEEIIPVRKKSKSAIDDDIKDSLAEEILALSEDFTIEEVFISIRSMEMFKVESDECVVRGCDNPSTTSGYCRYHYIKLWKDVKKKELILSEGRLAKIIEELVGKYPMKYIETIIQDLADDKAFNHVLKDLDIETDETEIDGFDDEEALDDDQDIAFETKVVKPSFDD